MGIVMFTSAFLLLLVSMSPTVMASVDSTAPLLGSCFLHQLAFPDGPQNADLSQPLCNLVQLNLEAFSCGDDAFNGLTGGDFIDMYSDAQAQFCSRNVDTIAQVLEGSHPQGQNILETSMAELVFVIGQKSSARRNLFFRQLIDATPDPWKPVAVIGVVFGICLVIGAACIFSWADVLLLARSLLRRTQWPSSDPPTSSKSVLTTTLTALSVNYPCPNSWRFSPLVFAL